jgi:hypothetical protein
MPKPRKNEVIQAPYFTWKLRLRDGVYYADGRANSTNVGRHSLHERDHAAALERLGELDVAKAIEHGLAVATPNRPGDKRLPLPEGREMYDSWIQRPFAVGGDMCEPRDIRTRGYELAGSPR